MNGKAGTSGTEEVKKGVENRGRQQNKVTGLFIERVYSYGRCIPVSPLKMLAVRIEQRESAMVRPAQRSHTIWQKLPRWKLVQSCIASRFTFSSCYFDLWCNENSFRPQHR